MFMSKKPSRPCVQLQSISISNRLLCSDKPSLVRLGGQKVITNDHRNLIRQDLAIAQVLTHPQYKRSLYYNDIGLLRLATKVR